MRKNHMGKYAAKGIALMLCAVLILSGSAVKAAGTAPGKEENVYVRLSRDGDVDEIYVVNTYFLEEETDITDYGKYDSVKNLTTGEEIQTKGDRISFRASAGRFSYQGNLKTKELPWKISISYELDGKKTRAEELAGKSGTLKIRICVSGNDRASGDFFDHYTLRVSVPMDMNRCSNVQAAGATVENEGIRKKLIYDILSGREREIIITADVLDFEMGEIVFQGFPMALDVDRDTFSMDDLYERTGEVTDAADEFDDGAKELSDGTDALREGADGLKEGVDSLRDGLKSYADGTKTLSDGVEELSDGTSDLADGMEELHDGINELRDGVNGEDGAASGARKLAEGVEKLEAGAKQLAEGVSALIAMIKGSSAELDETGKGLLSTAEQMSAQLQLMQIPGFSSRSDLSVQGNLEALSQYLEGTIKMILSLGGSSGIAEDADGRSEEERTLRPEEEKDGKAKDEESQDEEADGENDGRDASDGSDGDDGTENGNGSGNASTDGSGNDGKGSGSNSGNASTDGSGNDGKGSGSGSGNASTDGSGNDGKGSGSNSGNASTDGSGNDGKGSGSGSGNASTDGSGNDGKGSGSNSGNASTDGSGNDGTGSGSGSGNASTDGTDRAENESNPGNSASGGFESGMKGGAEKAPGAGGSSGNPDPAGDESRPDDIAKAGYGSGFGGRAGTEAVRRAGFDSDDSLGRGVGTVSLRTESEVMPLFRREAGPDTGVLRLSETGSDVSQAGPGGSQTGPGTGGGFPDLQEIAGRLFQMKAGVDKLLGCYEVMGKFSSPSNLSQLSKLEEGASALSGGVSELSDGADSLADGIGELGAGISKLSEGSGELSDGTRELADGVSDLADGTRELTDASDDLLDGTDQLAEGTADLAEGTRELSDGVVELQDGTDEFRENSGDMETRLDEEIDRIVTDLTGSGYEPESFLSDKNTNVELVLFSMKTEEIRIPEREPVESPREKPSFWQRLLRLFGIETD